MTVALVTGGTRGIGFAIAKSLLSSGMKVALCGRSDKSVSCAVAALSNEYQADTILGSAVDVTNHDAVNQFIKHVVETWGGLHVLVNNAGITKDTLLLRMKPDDFDTVIQTNLNAVFYMTKAALRPMLRQKYGRIITIGSIVGTMGNPGQANYSAAKAGLIGFSKSVAKEIGSKQITVNVVSPGFIETDMTATLPKSYLDSIIEQVPMKRLGSVDDVANIVSFLASDQASYITGQVIHVDGGIL